MTNRYIAGTVNADGSRKSGDEFSSNKTTKGHYVVSFRPAFTQISGGSVTQVYPNDGDTRDNAVIISLNADSVYLKTGDSSGDAQDRSFSFIFAGTGTVAME